MTKAKKKSASKSKAWARLTVDQKNIKAGLPSRESLSRSYNNRRDGGRSSAVAFAEEQQSSKE